MKPLILREHAVIRMAERRISKEAIRQIVQHGEAIEIYQDDKPYPSRLILGWFGTRPLHVVAAESPEEIIIITVYEPNPNQWKEGFRERKEP